MSGGGDGWLGLFLAFVPHAWRDSVRLDVREEAASGPIGRAWMAFQIVAIAISLHWVFTRSALMSDIRYAIRSLLAARWFTVGAVLTFALGIGVNVAVFSAVDRMLFRPLPYARPNDLFVMREVNKASGTSYGTMPALYLVETRRLHRGIVDASMAGFSTSFTLSQDPVDEPYFRLTSVSYNTLSVFGARPVIGRDFVRDDAVARHASALISYRFWQTRLGGASDVIGRHIWSSRSPVEIVGVLPPDFIAASSFLDPASEGLVLDFETMEAAGPTDRAPTPYVRLKPGVDPQAAAAELNAIAVATKALLPPDRPNAPATELRLVPLREALFGAYTDYLGLVAAAAGIVLLVACGNLASLMLVRFRSREQVAAIQRALGASTSRLVTSALVETALLSLAGAVVGLATYAWAAAGLRTLLPPIFSHYTAGAADLRVIGFTVAAAVASALAVGIVPSWRMAHIDPMGVLKRSHIGARSGRRGGSRLLAIEAALSVLLVAASAATGRSLLKLERTDLGFVPTGLSRVTIRLAATNDERTRLEQYLQALDVLRQQPGVRQAGAANDIFLSGSVGWKRFGKGFSTGVRSNVTDGLFETLGTRVLAGRMVSARDIATRAPVAVVNESGLHQLWPGIAPAQGLGRYLPFDDEPQREVIGVVSDTRSAAAANVRPELFLPVEPAEVRGLDFVARADPQTKLSVGGLRDAIRVRVAAPMTVAIEPVTTSLEASLKDQRFRAGLFLSFGIVALILAAVGLYAVGTSEVALRRAEMGIRITLGATPADLRRMVIRDSVIPVGIGLAIGLAATFWAARFLQAFLYRVDARNPEALAVVTIALLAVAIAAAWIPARRAARTDPAIVLRAQ